MGLERAKGEREREREKSGLRERGRERWKELQRTEKLCMSVSIS